MGGMYRGILAIFAVTLFTVVVTTTRIVAQDNNIYIGSVAWSPDGTLIAAAGSQGFIQIWNATTGELLLGFEGHAGLISTISWNPDSTRIATASPIDKVVRIWNANTGQLVAELEGNRLYEGSAFVDWNPNGTKLVSIGAIADGGLPLLLWTVEDDIFQPLPAATNLSVYDIVWSPDGTQLAVANVLGVYIFDNVSSDVLESRAIAPFHTSLAWSPDGTKLAATEVTSGVVDILDVSTGQILTSIQGSARTPETGIASIGFFPDGETLITDEYDGSTQIWDTTTGELIETITLDRQGGRFLMSLSPYGGRLALGNSAPANETAATQSRNDQVIQTLANGAVQIVVPDPSIERLQAIAEACNAAPQVDTAINATLDQVESNARPIDDFIVRVETLPQDALPAGCAADLLAVAETIAAE